MSKHLLKEITSKIGSGATPTGGKGAYKGGDYSLIRSQNVLDISFLREGLVYINDEQAKKLDGVKVESGDVLFNITGDSICRCCIVPDDILPARVNQHVAIIRPKSVNSAYLMYYLQYLKPYLMSICGNGSSRNALTKDSLEKLEIEISPFSNSIAEILSSLDKKIINNKRITSELESFAKTIYDYWFLQFEFPNEEGKPYKSSGGKMVWCEELKREIPEGWEACKLKDEALLIKDGTHNPPKRVMTGIPLLTGTMFGNCFLEYGKATYVSETDYHSIHSQYQPAEDDIVITKIGTIGNVNMLTKRDIPITIHCNSAIIRMKDLYKKAFQVCLFKSDEFQKRLRAVKGRSIQEFISLDKISNVLFLKPNQSIVKKFNELCNIYIQEMSVLQQQNDNLIALRDFLLPMLMNGQVTFKD